jgi:hypothetical protein
MLADRTKKNHVSTLIPARLFGLEFLDDTCGDLIHATVDVQMPSGRWNTTWNETEARKGWYSWRIENGMPVYITEDEDGFTRLNYNMSQEDFEDALQFDFESNDNTLVFQMRIAIRDGDNNVIAHLTQEWTQTVVGNGDASPCVDSTVTLAGATGDLTMAFDADQAT